MRKLLFIIILSLLVLNTACSKHLDKNVESSAIEGDMDMKDSSNKMVDFSCETNKGYTFELYNRADDKPVFINFWATWCGPCVMELPDLQDIYDEYKSKMNFLFINCGDSKEIIDSFLNTEGNDFTFPIGFDLENELSIRYNITGIPTTYILDKDNNISDMVVGARNKEDYIKLINKVIKND